jgi:hypothetical protein
MDQSPQYPKGDLRRMLTVLAAVDALESATLVKLAERTGIDKKTITTLIEQARTQARVVVAKNGPVYTIQDWGPVIKKTGARMCLTGALNAPSI